MLSVAGLRASQVGARNDERSAKARQIATSLDSYYQYGHTSTGVSPGQYPNTSEFTTIVSSESAEEYLTGVDSSALRFSWLPDSEVNIQSYYNTANLNDNENIAHITQQARESGKILYEPLTLRLGGAAVDSDRWQACIVSSQTCTRFNLYYLEEGSDELITVRGSHG